MGLGGMEMMLKSMGINPDEIKASIESFKQLAQTVADTQRGVDAKLSTLLISNSRIEGKLDELLSRGAEVVGKEEMAEQLGLDTSNYEVADGDKPGSNGN